MTSYKKGVPCKSTGPGRGFKIDQIMTQLINYFKATMRELKQVSWPTRKQSIIYTILVIVISAIVALYVGAFDYVFSQIISSLITII